MYQDALKIKYLYDHSAVGRWSRDSYCQQCISVCSFINSQIKFVTGRGLATYPKYLIYIALLTLLIVIHKT